jgi:hypothetical protein
MSFLNPLMLFGMAAIAVPIIIHFLNRRKFRKINWAAMKFVKLSVDQNQRRIRLEDLILLLIRCTLLALLALALARPVLKSSAVDVLGQAKVTAVIVLDNSYSMDLLGADGNSTAFEQARAAALATLGVMPTGSRVAVLLASDVVQSVIDEPTHDLNQAREVIDRAKVSHHATDLFPAVDRAMEILKGRAVLRKEIYIITDGQASGWQQGAEIQKLIEENQGEIEVYVLRVGDQKPSPNLAISRIENYDGLTPVNHPLRFEVEVANHDDAVAEDVTVGLYVDGQTNSVDSVTIPRVPPGGTTPVTLYASLEQEGYHEIRAAFSNPARADLSADNQSRLVVRAVKEVRVLMVHGDQDGRDILDRDHECFFLNIALSPGEDHFVKVEHKTSAKFVQGSLDRYTAVLLVNVPRFTPRDIEALENYLRQGGGLIFYPGDQVDVAHYQDELFAAHGILPSPWGDAMGDPAQDEVFVEFQKRAYEHPVTALWNNPDYSELGTARTFRRMPMDEHAVRPDVREAGPAKVVLRFANRPKNPAGKTKGGRREGPIGAPAIMERDWGRGRVYQFSTTADTDWGDLPIRAATVVPLLHRIIGNVQSRQDAGLNLRVGEPFIHPLDPLSGNREGTVYFRARNQTNSLTAEVLSDQNRTVLQFKDTDQAGVYEFQMKGGTEKRLFAVRHDPRESDLRKITDADLPLPASSIVHWKWDSDFANQVRAARKGAEYWLLILLAVFALVGLETYLAQKFSQSK